ncbi:MAG: cache domain-containing protein [Minisyncoccia bacterium]
MPFERLNFPPRLIDVALVLFQDSSIIPSPPNLSFFLGSESCLRFDKLKPSQPQFILDPHPFSGGPPRLQEAPDATNINTHSPLLLTANQYVLLLPVLQHINRNYVQGVHNTFGLCGMIDYNKVVVSLSLTEQRAFWVAILVFVVLLSVPVAIGTLWYHTYENLTAQTLAEQQTITNLAASALEVKLNRLISVAEAMASSSQISGDVAAGRFADAALAVSDLGNEPEFYDTFIDRVTLYGPDGIQRAAYPMLVGGLGSSATSSDWYKTLRTGAGEGFYVSNVVQRLSSPRINVVGIAVPVRNQGAISGFLVLQIPAHNFLEFGIDLSLGTYGFAYIVDTKGDLIAHPKFSSQTGEVVNYSFMPEVQAALAGNAGTRVDYDSDRAGKSIVAYEPLPQFHWGIVTQQPYGEAFAARDSMLPWFLAATLAAIVFDLLVSYLAFRLFAGRRFYQKL